MSFKKVEIKTIKSFEKMMMYAGNLILSRPEVCPQEIPLWRWVCLIIKLCLFVCNVFVAVSEVRAFAVVVNGNVKTKLINRHLTKLRKWVDWHNQRLPSCTSWWPDGRPSPDCHVWAKMPATIITSPPPSSSPSPSYSLSSSSTPTPLISPSSRLLLPDDQMTRWQTKSRLLRSNQGHLITAQSKNPRKGLKIWS